MIRQAFTIFFTFVGVFLFFAPVQAALVVNEIAAFEASGCEWVEIKNTGSETVNVEGWRFWEQNVNHGLAIGASSVSQDWMIDAGEYALIVQDDGDLFSGSCGEYAPPVGTVFDSSWGSLNESGELIGLKDADGNFIEQFLYITAPNFSLERVDATLAEYTNANWVEHANGHTFGRVNDNTTSPNPPLPPPPPEPHASPPLADPPSPALSQRIVINEFVSDPLTGEHEWVELYNTEDAIGDLAGWILRDGVQEIASLTGTIAARGFLVIELSGSKLNNAGDAIHLESPTRVVDRVSFGDWSDGEDGNAGDNAEAPEKGNTVARLLDGYDTGVDSNNFLETTTPTKGSANRIVSPVDPLVLPVAPPPPPQSSALASPSAEPPPAPSPIEIFSKPKPVISEKPSPPSGGVPPKAGKEPVKKQTETKKTETKKKTPSRASFEGMVSVEPGRLGAQYFYIAFSSSTASDVSGIQVYLHNKDFPDLARGDRVRVVGTLGTAYGEARLKLTNRADIEMLAQEDESLPIALMLSDIQSSAEGGIVEVEGEVTEAKRGLFFLDDGEGEIQVTIRERTGIDMTLLVGERFRVRGLLHRRGGDEWEILVRDAADLKRIEDGPVEGIVYAPKESYKGVFAVAASGVASFLLGLLARTRGAFLVGGLKRLIAKKSDRPGVDKEEIL